MTIQINGMAHMMLTVSRFEVARAFYRELLPHFGMGGTAISIEPCDPAYADQNFVQQRVGLHHLCLRARSREDVDKLAEVLREMNATIIRGPEEGTWAPGYYSVLFEDPDGIRLEMCFVPGARSPVGFSELHYAGEHHAHRDGTDRQSARDNRLSGWHSNHQD